MTHYHLLDDDDQVVAIVHVEQQGRHRPPRCVIRDAERQMDAWCSDPASPVTRWEAATCGC